MNKINEINGRNERDEVQERRERESVTVRAEEREGRGRGLTPGYWTEISKGIFKSVGVFDELEQGWE